ncbi:MAG: alpha/beta hydrolase [Gammaproteobacteria bacterium]|nr:MAG: alpha/beta hydrolase [Gammaproteobacteria bacterium]
MTGKVEFVSVPWDERALDIEYQWIGVANEAAPLLVFLHEGLGSLAMWRDFPERLCRAAGCRGLVYSRPGYGRSTARAKDENWDVDFMHRQAYALLPALLDRLDVDSETRPPWLFGHSDGGSIALLYAAAYPRRVAGIIVIAPHIMVEELSVKSIEQARVAYLQTDLRERLGRYHADPDSAFWGWNDIWLLPQFRGWSIEDEIGDIRCPLLAVQGVNDEYGTLEQVHGIARRVKQAEIIELRDCGHSPHRDQAQRLIDASTRFLESNTVGTFSDETGFYAQY